MTGATGAYAVGAHWIKAALQVNPFGYVGKNSPSKSFADDAAYNMAILDRCLAEGIDLIAVTDHWCIDTAMSLIEAAAERGIAALPGFEANSAEGVHLLVLFELGTDRATGEEQVQLRQLTDAYGGDLLADMTPEWSDELRETARAQVLDVLLRLADLHGASQQPRQQLHALARAHQTDPYAEHVVRQLIAAQIRGGEPSAALCTYRAFEDRLADLGVDPDPTTTRLVAGVRAASGPVRR